MCAQQAAMGTVLLTVRRSPFTFTSLPLPRELSFIGNVQSETGKGSENVGGLGGYNVIFNTIQNAEKPHPTGSENTAIPHFESKITEIPLEKLSNTAMPQTPMSPFKQQSCKICTIQVIRQLTPLRSGLTLTNTYSHFAWESYIARLHFLRCVKTDYNFCYLR